MLWQKRLHEMDVDALIIQDLGLLHLLHHRLPDLVLHASTQLSVSKPNMIEKLKQLGVQRVVLARECTMDEIRACVETGMEIEVFIHGAICICYSGQCYFFKCSLRSKWQSWYVCPTMSNAIYSVSR